MKAGAWTGIKPLLLANLTHNPISGASSNHAFPKLQKPYPSAFFSTGVRARTPRILDRVSRIQCPSCWLRISSRWTWMVTRMVSTFLLVLLLEGEVANSSTSPLYACEDVDNYYLSAKDLRGEALKKELNFIISGHHSLSYKEVWNALKILDASEVDEPETSPGILEIYSLRVVPKRLAGKPEGWNREHLWPRSYGLNDGPSITDLHNIRPADVNVNSSRGNKYYGECHISSIDCLKPANKEAATDTETDKKKWAPPMQVRGDVARALMYMAVRYGINQPGFPALKLSDHPSTKHKEMGLLSTLLKWNRMDHPSREEKLRNERICRIYQHNRNPFVDHPEYADLIWNKSSSKNTLLTHQARQKKF